MKGKKLHSGVKNVCIVLPTYNEAENVSKMLDKIYAVDTNGFRIYVLAVDDNSPDGTAQVVKNYGRKNNKVKVLERMKKEGLGIAYIEGMKEALRQFNPDVIFQMDADGQHNPDYIPRLLKPIVQGKADYVIGSRYVKGGQISEGWGAHRKLISFLARFSMQKGLRLGKIQDCSGGYKAISVAVFQKIDLDSLRDISKGYGFQAALLEEVVSNGFTVKEVPISFGERWMGESKMRMKDVMEGWQIIYKVRKKRFLQKINGGKK